MRENPRPIGYTEVQRSWVGTDNPDMPILMLNEVYAATAYVLYRNEIIKETDIVDASSVKWGTGTTGGYDKYVANSTGWNGGVYVEVATAATTTINFM